MDIYSGEKIFKGFSCLQFENLNYLQKFRHYLRTNIHRIFIFLLMNAGFVNNLFHKQFDNFCCKLQTGKTKTTPGTAGCPKNINAGLSFWHHRMTTNQVVKENISDWVFLNLKVQKSSVGRSLFLLKSTFVKNTNQIDQPFIELAICQLKLFYNCKTQIG